MSGSFPSIVVLLIASTVAVAAPADAAPAPFSVRTALGHVSVVDDTAASSGCTPLPSLSAFQLRRRTGLTVTWVDIDLDGDTDAVTLSRRGALHLWRNDGDGFFRRQPARAGPGTVTPPRHESLHDSTRHDAAIVGGPDRPVAEARGRATQVDLFAVGHIERAATVCCPAGTLRTGSPRSPPTPPLF